MSAGQAATRLNSHGNPITHSDIEHQERTIKLAGVS
jgi:hypothetical protein